MQTKTGPSVFYRHSFTERLIFTSRPDQDTRLALRAAGYRWNRAGWWWKNSNNTQPLKGKQLANLLTPVNDALNEAIEAEAATA